MSQDLKIRTLIGGIIIAIVFFGIGMVAGKHGNANRGQMGDRSAMQANPAGGNWQGGMQNGAAGARTGGANRGGGVAMGEIISSDATSITIKLQDGGSKVIYLTESTPVMKSTTGAKSDLVTGTTVTVMGTPNADGSVAASSVQIRPAGTIAPSAGAQASQVR